MDLRGSYVSWEGWVRETQEERRGLGLRRATRPNLWPLERDFSTNDYLGLSQHPDVKEAIREFADGGIGPRASPLVAGYTELHQTLEGLLAELKGTEAALLFPSGYSANISVLRALRNAPELAVFSDELNHASIVDGVQLLKGRAEIFTYPHLDVTALSDLMDRCSAKKKVVVTDTVFSMDGDLAPLDQLRALCDTHCALLIVDDAHGTLVFGASGGGVTDHFSVMPDLIVGTLSKAIGSLGGFVACSEAWREHLVNHARGFIYSTALPVPIVAASIAALNAASDGDLRGNLWERVDRFRAITGMGAGPIFPFILGDSSTALACAQEIEDRGYHVVAIRPPTVPQGTARIRVTLSSAHSLPDTESLAHLAAKFAKCGPI